MRALTLAAVAALLVATPAFAQPTARVTGGEIAVRTGPGSSYKAIGRLADGTEVSLDYCTRDDKWCFVTGQGWVNGSYLVGWAAKMDVTTPQSIGDGLFGRRDRNWNYDR
ncbi:SH3 domain-containing protein [Devosia sp. 2618]|uniref:SH3 domain-containing protein n=1 Tax=Devosia sp. 2618 TaxID=3156454 RepID=UPI0033971E1F